MALKDDVPKLIKWIESNQSILTHSKDLVCIYEGDLLRFIEEMFKQEMGPNTYKAVKSRIPPINILTKLVDKLSKIYQQSPNRTVVDGSDEDQALVDWYIEQFDMNNRWNQGNEFYNLDKKNLMQPFYDERRATPSLRAVPNDRYLPYSDNDMDPTQMTHLIFLAGRGLKKVRSATSDVKEVDIYWTWTDMEFIIYDSDSDVRLDLMTEMGNPEGVNKFSEIPGTYINQSQNFLVPPADSDTKRMSILIPALVGDLNYAAKFQSFSQIFVFNAKDADWTIAPNAIQFLDSKGGEEKEPKIQVVKPEVDITEVIQLTVTQLAMWLESKGIKPGSMGSVTKDSLASGVSKIIDEMDTAELRQKQVTVYSRAESEFWDLVLNKMHPVWVEENKVENRHIFSPTASVDVSFIEQRPIISRKEVVETAQMEVSNGFLSTMSAMKRLNPDWSDDRIEEEMQLMDEENTVTVQPTEPVEPIEPIEDPDGLAED